MVLIAKTTPSTPMSGCGRKTAAGVAVLQAAMNRSNDEGCEDVDYNSIFDTFMFIFHTAFHTIKPAPQRIAKILITEANLKCTENITAGESNITAATAAATNQSTFPATVQPSAYVYASRVLLAAG